jgi:hypothetical protein
MAVGALVGGAAVLIGALAFRRQRNKAASEDSPIMIKGGSLSVGLHDLFNWAVLDDPNDDGAYTVDSAATHKAKWEVSVASLEAGFPVGAQVTLPQVSSVRIDLVEDDGTPLDTITIKFRLGVLSFRATNDRRFGTNRESRKVNKSKRHKRRAYHRKINGKADFDVAKIVVRSNGTDYPFPRTPTDEVPDYVLAFDFAN